MVIGQRASFDSERILNVKRHDRSVIFAVYDRPYIYHSLFVKGTNVAVLVDSRYIFVGRTPIKLQSFNGEIPRVGLDRKSEILPRIDVYGAGRLLKSVGRVYYRPERKTRQRRYRRRAFDYVYGNSLRTALRSNGDICRSRTYAEYFAVIDAHVTFA